MKNDNIFKLKYTPDESKEYETEDICAEWNEIKGLKYIGKKGIVNCRGVKFTLVKSESVSESDCVFLRITPITNALSTNCKIEIPLNHLGILLEDLTEVMEDNKIN
jgi:hypothetical protein